MAVESSSLEGAMDANDVILACSELLTSTLRLQPDSPSMHYCELLQSNGCATNSCVSCTACTGTLSTIDCPTSCNQPVQVPASPDRNQFVSTRNAAPEITIFHEHAGQAAETSESGLPLRLLAGSSHMEKHLPRIWRN